jgi:hypothetical protein
MSTFEVKRVYGGPLSGITAVLENEDGEEFVAHPSSGPNFDESLGNQIATGRVYRIDEKGNKIK